MLTIFLFLNLFLHVIAFAWMKVEHNLYIFRLAVISLTIALASSIYDTLIFGFGFGYGFSGGFALTLFNDCLRINQAILAQESLLLLIALILLITYRDFKFKPEFYLILFTNLISATYLLESYNFIIFFISWELFNLSLYILIVANGVQKQEALSASLKYFLLSAFSTAFLLLGIAMIYHITGSLEFQSIYIAMSAVPGLPGKGPTGGGGFHDIDFPVIFIIFALLFKMGAAPLHYWAPDLYDTTKLPIAAYISNIPKLLYILLALNLVDFLECQNYFFIIAGFLSIIIGSLGLFQQFKIRRFLAFSAIANLGYFLIIIQYSGLVLYNVVIYMIPVLNIFVILIYLNSLYEKDFDSFDSLKGLFKINPFLAFSFIISLFSIAGIPPLPGFFAKYLLLSKAFMVFNPSLFAIIIIMTVIAVANYLRLAYLILFANPRYSLPILKLDGNLFSQPTFVILVLNFKLIALFTYMDMMSFIFSYIGYSI